MLKSFSGFQQKRSLVFGTIICLTLSIVAVYLFSASQFSSVAESESVTHYINIGANRLRCPKDGSTRHFLPRSSGARCIDGSPPAFYHRPGWGSGAKKWQVYFEGGGWCFDPSWCAQRATMHYGSSNEYLPCLTKAMIKDNLSNDPVTNSYMYNWNTIHVKYCDGTSYSSNTEIEYNGQVLHMKGQINRDVTIRTLLENFGMRNATDVVISGCSAGGLAVYLGIDAMADIIHEYNAQIQVRGLVLSGFFLGYSSNESAPVQKAAYRGRDDGIVNDRLDYYQALKAVYNMANLSAGINAACTQVHGADCVFAATVGRFLRTPVFSLQPQYDSWQLLHVLAKAFTIPQANAFGALVQHQLIETFFPHKIPQLSVETSPHSNASSSDRIPPATTTASSVPRHGAYIESCAHHCFGCSSGGIDTWQNTVIKAENTHHYYHTINNHTSNTSAKDKLAAQSTSRTMPVNSFGQNDRDEGMRSTFRKLNANGRNPKYFSPAAAFAAWHQWTATTTTKEGGRGRRMSSTAERRLRSSSGSNVLSSSASSARLNEQGRKLETVVNQTSTSIDAASTSLARNESSSPTPTPPPLHPSTQAEALDVEDVDTFEPLFVQQRAYPCHDCCVCRVQPVVSG